MGLYPTFRGTNPTIPHLCAEYNAFQIRLQGIFSRQRCCILSIFRCFSIFFPSLRNMCSMSKNAKIRQNTIYSVLPYFLSTRYSIGDFSLFSAPTSSSKYTKQRRKFRQFCLFYYSPICLFCSCSCCACIFSAEAERKRIRDSFTSSNAA